MKLKLGSLELDAEFYEPPPAPKPYPGRALDPHWWPREHIMKFAPDDFNSTTKVFLASYDCSTQQTFFSDDAKRGFVRSEAVLTTFVSGATNVPNDKDSAKSIALGMKLLRRAGLASPKALDREIQRKLLSNIMPFDIGPIIGKFKPSLSCVVYGWIKWVHLSLRIPNDPHHGLILVSFPARLDIEADETKDCTIPPYVADEKGERLQISQVGTANANAASELTDILKALEKREKAERTKRKAERIKKRMTSKEGIIERVTEDLRKLAALLEKYISEDLARDDLSEPERAKRMKQMEDAFKAREKELKEARARLRRELDGLRADLAELREGE